LKLGQLTRRYWKVRLVHLVDVLIIDLFNIMQQRWLTARRSLVLRRTTEFE
jgi:hypothetical protein